MILRPILMALGLVLGLAAFNSIMGLAGGIFSNYAADMTPLSDNSLLTLGIYLAVYASLAYTMANSAFKMVDLMPNWVMNWVGARLDTYVDDASIIQGQVQQYTSTLAYSSRPAGSGGTPTPEEVKQKQAQGLGQGAQAAAAAQQSGSTPNQAPNNPAPTSGKRPVV